MKEDYVSFETSKLLKEKGFDEHTVKQQWIEEAVDFISKRFYIGINNRITSKENYYSLTELIRDFEKAMKGE